jgi:hypothetical protein
MPADQDRLAQPEHVPEQPPPPDQQDAYDPPVPTEVAWTDAGAEYVNPDNIREPTGSLRDLHDRIEHLPEWHPSFPFREDGSRKPEPLDLSQYELPLPGDPDYSPNQDLPPPKDTVPSDSWECRGRSLTVDQSRIAEETREWFRTAEGRDSDGNYGDDGLTPAMRRIESRLEHGHLVDGTEKFALKGTDRLKEKLADMIRAEPDKSAHELAREIHDGVRYTFLFREDSYLDGVKEATEEIRDSGYELGILKNTWNNDEYKGVNTRWHDQTSGIKFEVQFHTEASWAAKQQTHEAYEGINDPDTSPEERERLRNYQRDVTAQLKNPPGWEQISNYRRDGW